MISKILPLVIGMWWMTSSLRQVKVRPRPSLWWRDETEEEQLELEQEIALRLLYSEPTLAVFQVKEDPEGVLTCFSHPFRQRLEGGRAVRQLSRRLGCRVVDIILLVGRETEAGRTWVPELFQPPLKRPQNLLLVRTSEPED
jgi:hypothetical protein